MKIIRNSNVISGIPAGCSIALGNFDGVHLGHQAILRECISQAKRLGVPSAVMTFEPHPREFFAKDSAKLRIYPFRRKAELLNEAGIDLLYVTRFNAAFAAQSADNFIALLRDTLNVTHVITGYNFAFGKGRGGNTEFLAARAHELGFGFTACAPVTAQGEVVSSSAIRAHLSKGEMAQAQALLGKPYEIAGRVRHGDKRGRELGFPTANLTLSPLFKPHFGVYAVRLRVDGESQWYDGVASLGVRPMFAVSEPLLEVHGFDMNRTLYGKRLHVRFAGFLRDEARFDSVEALKAQMSADCMQARQLLLTAGI